MNSLSGWPIGPEAPATIGDLPPRPIPAALIIDSRGGIEDLAGTSSDIVGTTTGTNNLDLENLLASTDQGGRDVLSASLNRALTGECHTAAGILTIFGPNGRLTTVDWQVLPFQNAGGIRRVLLLLTAASPKMDPFSPRGQWPGSRKDLESKGMVWEAKLESGQITYTAAPGDDLFGFTRDAWLAPGFWSRIVHPDDHIWVSTARAEALGKLGRFTCEYRMRSASGKTHRVRDFSSIVSGQNGNEFLRGGLVDVTAGDLIEETGLRRDDFIEELAEATPVIWYLYDAKTQRAVYVSGGGVRALGYTPEALVGMEPFFILALGHPDEVQGHWLSSTAFPPFDGAIEREFRLRSGDGRWVWFRGFEMEVKDHHFGEGLKIAGVARDVTERRESVEELAEREAMFRRLVEATHVVPFEFDFYSGRFTYIGPQVEKLLGFPHVDWYRATFWPSLVHPDDFASLIQCYRKALEQTETDFEHEFRVQAVGGVRWIRQIIRAGETDGAARRGSGYLVDITTAKAVEAERDLARRNLRDLAQMRVQELENERTVIAREVHDELGQALTALRIELAWLTQRFGDRLPIEDSIRFLEKISGMDKEVETTLDCMRRIISRLRPPVLDQLGLGEAIEWQAREYSRRVGVRCVVVSNFRECEAETATAVFRIFQEVLTNVARHAKATRVDVRLDQDQDSLHLSVRDNGCGFSFENAQKLRKFGLLGMHERAVALGGALEIQSTLGEGTTISLAVPCLARTEIDL